MADAIASDAGDSLARWLDFDETAEPEIGTLRWLAAKHGITLQQVRARMGLVDRRSAKAPPPWHGLPLEPMLMVPRKGLFWFNSLLWRRTGIHEALAIGDRFERFTLPYPARIDKFTKVYPAPLSSIPWLE